MTWKQERKANPYLHHQWWYALRHWAFLSDSYWLFCLLGDVSFLRGKQYQSEIPLPH